MPRIQDLRLPPQSQEGPHLTAPNAEPTKTSRLLKKPHRLRCATIWMYYCVVFVHASSLLLTRAAAAANPEAQAAGELRKTRSALRAPIVFTSSACRARLAMAHANP